jgi:Kef-type K+ transport system membrane component KefB
LKSRDVAVILCCLLFCLTGLQTEIGLINDSYLWKVTAAIIAVAVIGKFLGRLWLRLLGKTGKIV